ncbi:hypothetical protein MXB_1020 [Myxobolus squamalis]|nr:hypothetical protein MXB_1020 [Myxobolus squamalis]
MRIMLYLYFKNIYSELVLLTPLNHVLLLPINKGGLEPPIFVDVDAEVYITDVYEIELYLAKIPPNLHNPEIFKDTSRNIYFHFLIFTVFPTRNRLISLRNDICKIETKLETTGGPFLTGSAPCVTDCILFPILFQIERFFYFTRLENIFSSERYPRVFQYYQMMYNLPNTEHMKADRNSLIQFFIYNSVDPNVFK